MPVEDGVGPDGSCTVLRLPAASPRLLREDGPWDGPVYAYRTAEIWADATGERWQVWIEDHPLRGLTLPSIARAIRIIDAWTDGYRLPSP